LIMSGGEPVGYIRWQFVSRAVLDSLGLSEIPDNSVDVDLLIGDPAFVRRGIGRCVLQLLTEALRARDDVSLLALSTSVHNHTARRAFEAAGFRVLRQYTPSGYGLCNLMVLELFTHGGSASEKRA